MEQRVKDSFNRLFHKQGGYFDLEGFFSYAKSRTKHEELPAYEEQGGFLQEIIEEGRMLIASHIPRYINLPKVHLAYLNNENLGAVVKQDPESQEYFIGLYFGSVNLLREFFSRILCSPIIIPWIGDVSIEKAEKSNNPFIINTTVLSEFIKSYPDIRAHPHSQDRVMTAKTLTSIATYFLFLHEFGHIAKGHLRLIQSLLLGSASIPMFIDAPEELAYSPVPDIIKHALETDADHFATFHSVTMVYKMFNIKLNEESFMRSLELWSLAVFSFFRLFSLIPYYKVEDVAKHTHPSAAIRIFLAIDDASDTIVRLSKTILGKQLNGNDISSSLMNNLLNLQSAIEDICDSKEVLILGTVPILYATAEYQNYRNTMTDIHDETLHKLSSFKYAFANP